MSVNLHAQLAKWLLGVHPSLTGFPCECHVFPSDFGLNSQNVVVIEVMILVSSRIADAVSCGYHPFSTTSISNRDF